MKYIDLLRIATNDGFNVKEYLDPKKPITKGFHQEALFNIFYVFWSKTRNKYIPSGGNFSGGTALSVKFDIAIFMNQNVRTGGDISDFTMIDYEKKKLIVFSSKCLVKYGGRNMDVEKIMENTYDFKTEVRLIVHNKQKFIDDMKSQRDTTPDRSNHTVYDWEDIQNMIDDFKGDVSSINKVCSLYKSMYVKIRPRFGQYIVSHTTTEILKKHPKAINGSICRFGKTYCMAYDVLLSGLNHFIFITSKPKTMSAISSIFIKYDDFKDHEVFNFSSESDIKKFKKSNAKKSVVFVSIQTLKSKCKGLLIKGMNRRNTMCLIDEFHDSGETEATLKVLNTHKLFELPTVFYSATYDKIKSFYKIPDTAIVSWGIEDNVWCSDIKNGVCHLKTKYGSIVDDALTLYTIDEIESHYSKLPRLKFIIDKPSQPCLEGFSKKNKTDGSIGYSFDAVKMIKNINSKYELVNEDAVINYFQRMLGGGIKDNEFDVFVHSKGMIDTYKEMCAKDGQKHGRIIPVYMGNGIVEGEQVKNSETLIYQCVECIITCLKKYRKTKMKGIDNYALINYKTNTKDPEAWFEQIVAENPEKTIILFLGNSLTTGTTNKYCDLLKLPRRIDSHDLFWQTICRAMNESVERNKKYAYICIDDYQSLGGLTSVVRHMKLKGESEASAWKRLLKQNIFNIVDIDYDGKFVDTETYEPLIESIYGRVRDTIPYKDNLNRFVQDIDFGDIKLLSRYLVNLVKKDTRVELKKLVEKLNKMKEKGIEKGIDVDKLEKKVKEKEEDVVKDDSKNCYEMLSVLVTTYVMLSIGDKINIVDVIDYLKQNKRWDICVERCCKSFGLNSLNSITTINKLNTILMDNKNIGIVNESITTLKEQLKFNKSKQECYEICQEVIITTDIERKQYAEVLTPLSLVNEMLSKIPEDAWTDMNNDRVELPKIFDPCVGKGAFVVVVYDLLWKKLEDLIPDEEERRVTILEKMIYFADINPFNIYVTNMILDPAGKYKLNAFTGDSLEMEFDFKFDIIVGNPPYNKGGVRSHTGKLLGDKNETIWPKFIKFELSILREGGVLASVNPLSWLKSSHSLHHLLDNHIVWMLLWDNIKSLSTINAKIPISSFVMINEKNKDKLTTVDSFIQSKSVITTSQTLLSSQYTAPLAYHSIFDKLRDFIKVNRKLSVKRDTVKIDKKYPQIKLPKDYKLSDSYAVDTYRIKDGIIVRKTEHKHPAADKRKIIIANKASFAGAFIDNGRLSLCGNHKFYILGDNLENLLKLLNFKLFKLVTHYTKYGQDFLENCCFDYIPDIRNGIKEKDLYKQLRLTEEEIKLVENCN